MFYIESICFFYGSSTTRFPVLLAYSAYREFRKPVRLYVPCSGEFMSYLHPFFFFVNDYADFFRLDIIRLLCSDASIRNDRLMQDINVSQLKIDNQNVFQFANSPERYLFPLEIADELFCNYVARKYYSLFCDEVLIPLEDNFPKNVSERNRISSCRYDITNCCLEDLKPEGKRITYDRFRCKIRGFVASFNYFVDLCCSISCSLGKKVEKEKFFLDDKKIESYCRDYGDIQIYKIRKKIQEAIISSCAENVAKYFSFICIAEEIIKIEGENLSADIAKEIASVRYEWELSTLSPIDGAGLFIESSLCWIYSFYRDICRKHEILPFEESFFRGKYPECMNDLFKYRMPLKFYKNVYKNLSNAEREEIHSISFDAYLYDEGEKILEKFKGYEDNFDEEEIDYDDIRQVFYCFLIKGYFPSIFSFDCFFDNENNIVMKEIFFEDRKGRNFFDFKSVGDFIDMYDFHEAFEQSHRYEEDIKNSKESILLDKEAELMRLVGSIKNLIAEYANEKYIPTCNITRLTQAILRLEKEIREELKKNNGMVTSTFFSKNKNILLRMEEENRIAFLNYKNNFSDERIFSNSIDKEDFEDGINSKVAEICENIPAYDENIFDSSGNEVSRMMEVKKTGVKKMIHEKYLLDLRQIRDFVDKNFSNPELALLIIDAQRVLDIATNGYQHDECLQSLFEWFEKMEPIVIDGIEYFTHLNKVPASYRVS